MHDTNVTRFEPNVILMGLKTGDICVMHLYVHDISVTHLSMHDSFCHASMRA